jgi:hypothetical protein
MSESVLIDSAGAGVGGVIHHSHMGGEHLVRIDGQQQQQQYAFDTNRSW